MLKKLSRPKARPVPPLPSSATNDTDRLARAFLDALAREEGARRRWEVHGLTDPDDPVDALMEDGTGPARAEVRRPVLRADLAAAAVLVGRVFERHPDCLRLLRREAPVVVIETGSGAAVPHVRRVLRSCAWPADVTVHGPELGTHQPEGRAAVLFAREGGKDDGPETGNEVVVHTRHLGLPLVGVAPDPARDLPRDLLRIAEAHLVLPPLDAEGLALVVESVTGETPSIDLSQAAMNSLTLADLPLAVCADRSADACIAALERLLARQDAVDDGPTLHDLPAYGEAGEWGLACAADLLGYKAGRISWDDVDHRAALLSGPPGVGKTAWAHALARTAQVPIVATSVAQWNASRYLSGSLQAIRESFSEARRLAPCILFIDEIDGISDRSSLRDDYVEYWTQIINSTLEHLSADGLQGVIVVAATNHPERIDPAIRRAGRLDREIRIAKPTVADLSQIFRFHLGDDLPDDDTMPAACAAAGFTGADVESCVRRARGAARRAGRPLEMVDVLAEIRAGRPQPAPEARWRIAVHEAGHAVVASALGFGPIVGVSLDAEGGAMEIGQTLDGTATRERHEQLLTLLMAGRAAEICVLGDAAIGSGGDEGSDLCRATEIARALETKHGVGITGPVYVPEAQTLFVPGLMEAVRGRLEEAEERAVEILTEHQSAIATLAHALDQDGFLSGADAEAIIVSCSRGSATADLLETALAGRDGRRA
jgi:cell division protease FtsH